MSCTLLHVSCELEEVVEAGMLHAWHVACALDEVFMLPEEVVMAGRLHASCALEEVVMLRKVATCHLGAPKPTHSIICSCVSFSTEKKAHGRPH